MLRPLDQPRHRLATARNNRQQGVVLLVALIVLVALTLAGVALIRSVDTANLVAGNLSFHQTAVQAGERSTELAVTWLADPKNRPTLISTGSTASAGYVADGLTQAPAPGTSWDAYWTARTAGGLAPRAGGTDAAGNTVQYVIDRLCGGIGAPHLPSANCAREPASTNTGGSQSAGGLAPIGNNRVYYRITTRIEGPRSTVAYTQTIVAL